MITAEDQVVAVVDFVEPVDLGDPDLERSADLQKELRQEIQAI